jgi:histidine triad (HIT) family protein
MPSTTKKCIFCSIINGEAPGYIVYEDELCIAFLDITPLFEGHVLLLPKQHIETLMELPDELTAPLFNTAKRLSSSVQTAMDSQGIFVANNNVISQSVPHLHIHIVPRNKKDGLYGFFYPRKAYRDEEHMKEVAARIAKEMAG